MNKFDFSNLETFEKTVDSYPTYSKDEELLAIGLYKETEDEFFKELVIKNNLKNVLIVAKYYTNHYPSFNTLDLMQEGVMGLYSALELFDPYKYNNKFITFAGWHIKSTIQYYITLNYATVRKGAMNTVSSRLFCKSKPEDISAAHMLDKSMDDEDKEFENSLHDKLVDTKNELNENTILKIRLLEKIKFLTSEEQKVIKERFFDDCSLSEIGKRHKNSAEYVRIIEHQALRKLKGMMLE